MVSKRATVDLSMEAHRVLSDIASMLRVSKADALRRALGLTNFLLQQKNGGWRIILEDVQRKNRKEVVSI